MKQTSVSGTVSCVSAGSITHSVARNTSTETWKRHVSATFSCVSANVNPKLRLRKHLFPLAETWRKHAQKVVRFRCIRSNGNARKRHETGNGNTGYPSYFRNGLTCFCHVSVYGFLQFRPVGARGFFFSKQFSLVPSPPPFLHTNPPPPKKKMQYNRSHCT